MLVVTGSSVWPPMPALMVSSVDSSLDWYVRVLGFGLVSKTYSEGELASAHLKWAGYSWLLLVAEQKQIFGGSVKRSGLRFCFWAESDLYALTARAVQQGGQLTFGPVTHPWGLREVTFRDPDGYLLTFCQRAGLPKLTMTRSIASQSCPH